MDEESRQERLLILLAAVFCAVLIGYHAFYVPDAAVAWAQESSAVSAPPPGEEYTPRPVSSSAPAASVSPASSAPRQKAGSAAQKPPGGKININTATAAQLSDGLPGIGETLAGRIVEYRERNGPFRSAEDLRNVSGIGEKKYEAIRDLVAVR